MNMTEPTQFIAEGLRGTLRCDVDMRRHTSWRAGGRVERMYQPADLADLAEFLRALPVDEPLLAVGLGSNLLVRDGGLRGTILLLHGALGELHIEAKGTVSPQGGGRGCKATEVATTTLYAQAGVPGAKLARFAALHDLSGAEFFVGIPGTVGGMLTMNAGCYGTEIWDVTTRVQVMTRNGEVLERTAQDYDIAYRHVALRAQQEEWFVGGWFNFSAGDGEASRGKIKALLNKRIASQPLNLPNAGSVFRNPLGEYAARLIESCGLKGQQIGGAQVSLKHANFIVNTGAATAADIENLINEVQATVEEKTGIRLHPEVRIVGEAV
jgi:UDP-N-acetylmuramate dehydrogenase